MILTRRFPNYFTGFEETTHQVNNMEEMLAIDWVKNASEVDKFKRFSLSFHPAMGGFPAQNHLMAEYEGGDVYFVIGRFDATPDFLPAWKDEPLDHLNDPEVKDSFVEFCGGYEDETPI